MKTIEITFVEPLLATCAGNKDVATDFILNKNPNGEPAEDELESLATQEEELKKSSTVFMKDKQGKPFMWDYQIKGFFKDAAGILNRTMPKNEQLKAYKKVIDGLVFVAPRRIAINLSGGLTICERPLRAQTAQGERIALARSESAPEGTTIRCEIMCLDESLWDRIKTWLDYGRLRGLGQWRNSGMGRFEWSEIKALSKKNS
jgi:hypothetical protein